MRHRVNYLYFGAYFLLLILISSSNISTKENLGGSQLFFFLYAFGQIIVEMALLILCAALLQQIKSKMGSAIFIGFTFLAVFGHIFDYLMDRILDLSLWEVLNVFVFQESLVNFLFLLDASGISIWTWCLIFLSLIFLPLAGIFIYRLSDRIASRRPIHLSNAFLAQVLFCVPLGLLLSDFTASRVIHPDAYTSMKKTLPWKCTFLQPKNTLTALTHPLKEPLKEEAIASAIETDKTAPANLPNIFLFIVESLRADCITEEIAPNLAQFRKDFVPYDEAISNGNGTHVSWFSIFHSEFPYHWSEFQKERHRGAPALQLLKKWGYKIHVYASAELSYYGMEQVIFGDKSYLLDSKEFFRYVPPQSTADTDALAIDKLREDLVAHPEWGEGQIFIVFWDCTHFNYNWPKNWVPKFTPYAGGFSYFRPVQSEKMIRAIKNRYFNAVHYMDDLFGRTKELFQEDAVVIFTGDHGEEFFDHGHLFHNSHLTKAQTSIPLYCKFGDGTRPIARRNFISQMDIFPSVIDYVSGSVPAFLEGNSLFRPPSLPYAVTARFNGGSTPYEFFIHNGQNKLTVQFEDRKQIAESKMLKVISLKTKDDERVHTDDVDAWIECEFGPALKHLFPNSRKL